MEIKKHALAHYIGEADGLACALVEGRDGYWGMSVGGVDRGYIPEDALPTLAAIFREALPTEGQAALEDENRRLKDRVEQAEQYLSTLRQNVREAAQTLTDEVGLVGSESLLETAGRAVDVIKELKRKNAKASAEAAQDYVIRRAAVEEQVRRLKDEVTMLRATLDHRTKEVQEAKAEVRELRRHLHEARQAEQNGRAMARDGGSDV